MIINIQRCKLLADKINLQKYFVKKVLIYEKKRLWDYQIWQSHDFFFHFNRFVNICNKLEVKINEDCFRKNTNYFSCYKRSRKNGRTCGTERLQSHGAVSGIHDHGGDTGTSGSAGNLHGVITDYRRYRPGQIPGYQIPDIRLHYRACSVFLQ